MRKKQSVYLKCRVFDNIWEKKQSVYFECRVLDNIWEKNNQFILSVQSVECLIIFERKNNQFILSVQSALSVFNMRLDFWLYQ